MSKRDHLSRNEFHQSEKEGVHKLRGPSSFWIQDPELVFGELNLQEGDHFLDIGCGTGDYSLYASKIIGNSGQVCALDIQDKLITNLKEKAHQEGLKNIVALISDIAHPLPVEDKSVDVCFISTVLHSVDLAKYGPMLFREVRRVLKPDGRLVIIECKKEDLSRGPPLNMRISPEELENLVEKHGFWKINQVDLGFNYLIQFGVKN
ncbi:class I SAM-dependent methyltransferase [Methanobacterium petrolearium]|uniref:class I SAM-dependent methyltransferase n=1 Tax=Methanobacterium petrolearium TaxID=710190 RepID=UPI001AEAAD0A|nr:methyltransferase domain-containing protein [Methanobacterium petrolearium]MBP1946022.1 SAM-dependent methyltransferase [Methanobacterium petrolearium]BDZ70845.1 SAM-dependent methyltransferase [Methanobacterium petrolearium]